MISYTIQHQGYLVVGPQGVWHFTMFMDAYALAKDVKAIGGVCSILIYEIPLRVKRG